MIGDVDLALYRMSVSALALTAFIIALFFFALRRSIPRAEMRWWTYGWAANSAALAITMFFWYVQPDARVHGLVFAVYMAAKAIYVWLLLRGALELRAIRPRLLSSSSVLPAILAASTVSIFILTTRDRLGLVASIVITIGFGLGTI